MKSLVRVWGLLWALGLGRFLSRWIGEWSIGEHVDGMGADLCLRDREWQKWPITIVTGAYAGYVVGKYLGSYPLKRKKINFD